MRKVVFVFMLISVLSFGCVHPDGTTPPPSPLEAKIATQAIISIALLQEDLSQEKLEGLKGVLTGIKGVMVTTLSENPGDLGPVTQTLLKDLDPVYQDVTEAVVQILLLRVRPYIDQANPDLALAQSYVEAVLDGALGAVNRALTRLAAFNGLGDLDDDRGRWLRA